MRLLAALCAALALASCASDTPSKGVAYLNAPTALVSVQFSPLAVPFVATPTAVCPFVPSFTTAFDLVVVAADRLSLDGVLLRLNDGTHVGGPTLTFPRAELNRMFGSTLIAGTRTFPFQPQFACGTFIPRVIIADLDLLDANGVVRTMTATGRFE
jgi:hypothetical protein